MESQKPAHPKGLVCPACRKVEATIEQVTPRGVQFVCAACKHRWTKHSTAQAK
jgi:hypothetical protein